MNEVPVWIDRAPLFGCAVIIALAALRFFYAPEDQKRCEWIILVALLAIPFSLACEFMVVTLSAARPWKYDYIAFQIDGLTGFQPSFMLGRTFSRLRWLLLTSAFTYKAMQLVPVIVFGLYLWQRSMAEAFAALRLMFTMAVAATPIYLLLPVSGPVYAFPGFPFTPPATLTFQAVPLAAPPNAIQSVHFALALLIAWYARHWLLGKIAGLVFVLFTALGTLGLGEHYAIDLVAAVPYAFIVWKLGNSREVAERDEKDAVASS